MQLIPRTQTTSAFAYTILFNGSEVGNLQTFTPNSSRTLTRVRALAQGGLAGECLEIVESITDHTISITALELYRKNVIEFMGYSNFATIEDLKDAIDIREIITAPDGSERILDWQGCKLATFTKGGVAANGNVITDTATFWVTRVRKVK